MIPKAWSDIRDDEAVLLGKILNAVKLSLSSVQIITRTGFSVEDFRVYSPLAIISFGVPLKNSSKMYEGLLIEGTSVVVSHQLEELDDIRKRNLWMTLKQVFNS